jgi:type VI secretion system protein ImpK
MATTSTVFTPSIDGRSASPGVDFSSAQFRDFYSSLLLACEAALRVGAPEAAAAAQALSQQLVQRIEIQTLEARRMGGRSAADLESHARFLKAALADELLLNADWAGRSHWRHVLLETQLFRSSQAGDKVFDEIDQILAQREPSLRPVARLYLSALSLGFQGRFRGSVQLGDIADYRRELFQFIYQRPADLQGRDRALSHAAYSSTLSHLAAQRLPRMNRWWLIGLLLALALLTVSQLLWLWQSWPVRRAIDGMSVVAVPAGSVTLYASEAKPSVLASQATQSTADRHAALAVTGRAAFSDGVHLAHLG